MKTKILSTLLVIVTCALFTFSCDPELTGACRISKFLWEDQWHRAFYNSAGRLTDLVAPDSSHIVFYYNASNQLEKALIYKSAPTPKYRFEFIHGPTGIIQTDEFHNSTLGVEHTRTLFHYASATRVDYLIHQEFGTGTTVGFEIRQNMTYVNNDVSFIEGISSEINTAYTASRYDKKKNPFRLLALAVGNPTFFPVCFMTPFPVGEYDISFLSLFSFNNPLRAQYEIPGTGLDPEVETFANTYAGSFAKKITWNNTSYGITDFAVYEFDIDCSAHSSSGD